MSRTYALLAAAVAAAGIGGMAGYAFFGTRGGDDIFAQCRAGQTGGADIGGPFTLVDKTGKTVTDADVITGPTLVYFGYTYCPDVCPLDMAQNAEALDLLEAEGKTAGLVFITIDPARDTPDAVGDFTANLHPRAIGLTGSDDQIAAAAKAYRAFYQKREGDDPEEYLMDHSAFTYLMLPGYGFVDFLRNATPGPDRAKTVACYMDAAAAAN